MVVFPHGPDGGCLGAVSLQNSIIFGNTSNHTSGQDCNGIITSSGHNIIGDTTGCLNPTTGDLITHTLLGDYIGYTPLLPSRVN